MAKSANLESLLLTYSSALSPDDIKDLIYIARYADGYFVDHGDHMTKTMWSEMKNDPYELFYPMVYFVLHYFIETTVDSPMFCSDNYFINFKSDENFLIRLRNKLRKSFHKYSVSNI